MKDNIEMEKGGEGEPRTLYVNGAVSGTVPMSKMGEITLKEVMKPNTITFNATHPGGKGEVLRIEKGKFFYLGQEVDDVHQVYERFNEWLGYAEKEKSGDFTRIRLS